MTPDQRLRDGIADLQAGLTFFTRLPFRADPAAPRPELARAIWTAPVAGLLIGAMGAFVYWLATILNVPPLAAAGLALTATLLVTGALHEDGLADVADGFGGGATRERKLEIMRDSRIGTYGVCALVLNFILRASALADLAQPALVALALIAAHAAARATLPAFMALVPPARSDGLAAHAGRPLQGSVLAAALIGVVALGLCLGIAAGFVAIVLLLAIFAFLAWLCVRQIGGQTGDVLGALEQSGEIAVLLCASAFLGT